MDRAVEGAEVPPRVGAPAASGDPPKRSTRARSWLALALALALVAPPAGAQPASTYAQARAHFEAGVRLLDDARYADAAESLRRSVALRESPPALFALAVAYRGTRAYLRAIATLERFQVLATAEDARERRGAEALLRELRAALVHIALRVTGGATEVLIDGERLTTRDMDGEVVLDPGHHVFEARRRGFRPAVYEQDFEAGLGGAVSLDVAAHPLPATLVVETGVPEARIRVDGVSVGAGQHTMELPAGTHAVEVLFPGDDAQQRSVETVAGERMTVSLAPRATRGGLATRWWFWTGVGVLTTAAVVGGVLLFSRTEEPYPGTWTTSAIEAIRFGP